MKGRLLPEQLAILELKSKGTLNQLIHDWGNLGEEKIASLFHSNLFKSLMRLLDNEHTMIMSACPKHEYVYPHLVKIIEVMMWLQRKEKAIEKSSNAVLIDLLKKTQKTLTDILTTTVQSKKFPNETMVKEFDPYSQAKIAEDKNMELKDNLAEMILLAILNMANFYEPKTPEEIKLKKTVTQLLNNSRYKYNTSASLHVREDNEGNKYESYEDKKTYLGMLAILGLVFSDQTAPGSEFRRYLNSYFQEMSTRHILKIDDNLGDKEKKDLEKGVVRNLHGKLSLAEIFQYRPFKNKKEKSQASKDLEAALEAIISNLYHRKKSTAYFNEKDECIISVANEKDEKENFNITHLLLNQPLDHEIDLPEELCLYFTSALTGSHLYLAHSSVDITNAIQNKMLAAGSCVITVSREKKSYFVQDIYYIDLRKNAGQITDGCPDTVKDSIGHTLKKSGLLTEIEKNAIYQLEKRGEFSETFTALNDILAKEKVLFLKNIFAIMPNKAKLEASVKWPHSELSIAENAAINIYTGHFYTLLQPEERSYGTAKAPYDLQHAILAKYIKKFGNHILDPYALYRMKIEVLLFSHFISHGLAKLIQINQYRELEKIQANADNCQLFIASNKQMVEDFRESSQKEAIILLMAPDKKDIEIYHCIDKKFTKKIMHYDLVVTIDQEEFFHFTEDKNNFLVNLLSINRTNGHLMPVLDQEKTIVNDVLKQACWHCVLNTFHVRVNRVDLQGFYVNCIRPYVINTGIKEDGWVISAANEFVSASLGVARQFLTKEYGIYTVIHLPNGFMPVIIPISDSPCELEVLFGKNVKLVYFKVEFTSSFRGIIYHAIPTDYDFQLTSPKWSKLVSPQITSELKANIKICQSAVSAINDELLIEFKKIKSLTTNDAEIQALNLVEKYFNHEKPASASVQKSCINGTPLHVFIPPENDNNNTKSIKKHVEEYYTDAHSTNHYVAVPMDENEKVSLKIYYVKPDGSIIHVLPNLTGMPGSTLKDITHHLLSRQSNSLSKESLDNHDMMAKLNHIISQSSQSCQLPLIIDIKGDVQITHVNPNFKKRKRPVSLGILDKFKMKIHGSVYHHAPLKREEDPAYQGLRDKIKKKLYLEEAVSLHEANLIREKKFAKNGVLDREKSKLPKIAESIYAILSRLAATTPKKHKKHFKSSSSDSHEDQRPRVPAMLKNLSERLSQDNEKDIFPVLNPFVTRIIYYLSKKSNIKLENNIDLLLFLHLTHAIYSAFPSEEIGQMKSIKESLVSWTKEYPMTGINAYLKTHDCSLDLGENKVLDEHDYHIMNATAAKLDALSQRNIDKYRVFLSEAAGPSLSRRNNLNQLDKDIAAFLRIKDCADLNAEEDLLTIKTSLAPLQEKLSKIKSKCFTSQAEYDIYKDLLNGLIAWANHIYPKEKEISLVDSRSIIKKRHSAAYKKNLPYQLDIKFHDRKNKSVPPKQLEPSTSEEVPSITITDMDVVNQAGPALNSGKIDAGTTLQGAILAGHGQEVKHILASTPDDSIVNVLTKKDEAGHVPLHHAIKLQGDPDQKRIILKSLLFQYAKNKIALDGERFVNTPDQEGVKIMTFLGTKYGYYKGRLKTDPIYKPKLK